MDRITVATSTEQADDPLACYVKELGVSLYRGPIDNVFRRFQLCLEQFPCDWFFRVCADSPLLDSGLLTTALTYTGRSDLDLVTNVQPRTFPMGHSVELLNSATYAHLDSDHLSPEQQEHLTKVYYESPERFRVLNLDSGDPSQKDINFCVDTIEDLRRLEDLLEKTEDLGIPGLH